jgi:DNA-binding PadR family transcriptional regulator
MQPAELLGQYEFYVLEAVHRGVLSARWLAGQVHGLGEQPGGEATLYEVLHRCERAGLVRSRRDGAGRRYQLTAAGRARLRTDRRFRTALARVLMRRSAARGTCH